MVVLTNERYKTYQTGFSFCHLGHALGVGLGVLRGPTLNSIMLSPPKPLDQIQPNSVCELLTCMGHATTKIFWTRPQGHWGGVKDQISVNFNYNSTSKIFIPNFLCVLTNDIYETYQTGFSFCRLGHALGMGLGGT